MLLLALSCAASGQTKADRFDALVSTYGKAGFINVVLIGERGRIIYSRGVGGADFGAHVANTPQTKFGIDHQTTAGIVLAGIRINQKPV